MKRPAARKRKWSAFEILQFRIAQAHWRWKVWKQLFVADPAGPDDASGWQAVMKSVAPAFFSMLHDVLLQDVVLRICKLFDPPMGGPVSAKRTNLSLAAAREKAKLDLTAATVDEARKKTFSLQRAAKALEEWRHRKFAHDDERTSTGADSLPPLRFKQIEDCLARAAAIVRMLEPDSGSSAYAYGALIARGDGNSIKQALRCAEEYRRACLAAGRRPLSKAGSAISVSR